MNRWPDGETAIEDDLVRAAGAVLWREGGGRQGGGDVEVALIHRPKYDDWTFPKGKLEKGEHVLACAVREVTEETGVIPRLGRPLSTHLYQVDGRPKRVDYWAATARADTSERSPWGRFVPGTEVDALEWLTPAAAADRLSYERDVELLREFAAGPRRTVPLIILRHASAGERSEWRDLDALRPLDRPGRAEARELAGLLSAFEPVRSISSGTARCVETLLPYALAERMAVATDLAFTVGETGPGVSRARIAEVAAEGVGAVVCTHRELVPMLLAEMSAWPGGSMPPEAVPRKAGFWVLHLVTDDAGAVTGVAATERHTVAG